MLSAGLCVLATGAGGVAALLSGVLGAVDVVFAVNSLGGADLPGNNPVKLATAARLATVTEVAATISRGCSLFSVVMAFSLHVLRQ